MGKMGKLRSRVCQTQADNSSGSFAGIDSLNIG